MGAASVLAAPTKLVGDVMDCLKLEGLSKSFGSLVVTDEVSLTMPEGQALGIIGPNGAGKTTLFNLVSGAYNPDAGKIELFGRDITNVPAADRIRAGIGRTFQVPRPFTGLTVYENLLVAAEFGGGEDEDVAREHCRDILSELGLEPMANISAGALRLLDRKRLEMARALATRPKLLLLDEIAGGLTEFETEELVESINRLKQRGVGIIWIEHVVHALMSVIDRLVVLDFGKVIADGAPQSTFNDPQVQEIYMGIEA